MDYGGDENIQSTRHWSNETKVAEEQTRQHIRDFLRDAWRRLNMKLLSAQQQHQQAVFSHSFMNMNLNIARVSLCMYDYKDDIGVL
ncbi:Tricyclene synthase [Nymphaea thermarum]|nr:Tricyclene synthase [Nymphaea thermarum]